MSANHRGFFKRNSSRLGSKKVLDVGEDVGNRKFYEEARVPADDVGNHLDVAGHMSLVHDSLGNSVDEEPCHMKSGVLACLAPHQSSGRSKGRQKTKPMPMQAEHDARRQSSSRPLAKRVSPPPLVKDHEPTMRAANEASDEGYLEKLSLEFARLLREGHGMPFSFSMKVYRDTHQIDEQTELNEIESMAKLIEYVLQKTAIEADVSYVRYRTPQHRFIVFMVNPELRDPQGNKALISALRQIVKPYEGKHALMDMNILIILANAQGIIEGQMDKIGAQKIN